MKIGIVNYSLGNVGSVFSALEFLRQDVCLVSDSKGLKMVDLIILAGVGNFKTAVKKLHEQQLTEALQEMVVVKKKPVLGICLGMQLFADASHEDGYNAGFGWIHGEVVPIEGEGLRVPHMGWNLIDAKDELLFQRMLYQTFYFMHSYHFLPSDPSVVKATTKYGQLEIVSAVQRDHIFGVQFHPEKSQGDGLRLLRNVLEVVAC